MNICLNSNLPESRFNSKKGCLAILKISDVSLPLALTHYHRRKYSLFTKTWFRWMSTYQTHEELFSATLHYLIR